MATAQSNQSRFSSVRQPTWDIAYLFPEQGSWTEDDYLALESTRLIEFSEGVLEVLPMPTTSHQLITAYLYGLVAAFISHADLGTVVFSPLRVRLWKGKYREPDVVFLTRAHRGRIHENYWQGADLVMEVTSADKDSRQRDLVTKRREYARARIPEYWIVDPQAGRITVLRLAGKRYLVHGEFGPGEQATSLVLEGFAADVRRVLAAGRSGRRGR